ncbi:LuxR C-terminal-related transcriptional regulator [Agrobacterium sp. ES01]|uniref:helix-turn-helix transcriptional regulator n=1 Tax=Agrobacterium sp. ES01 TaxID=3420714 RepID=UPI003D0CE8F2
MIIAERQSLLNSEISGCETKTQFSEVMHRIAHEFGYAYFAVMTAPGPNDSLAAPLVHYGSVPLPFLREFDRNHYLRDCPIGGRVKDSVLPQMWRINDPNIAYRFDCSDAMCELFLRFGMSSGVVLNFNSVDSTRFLIRFYGSRPLLNQSELNELSMVSLHAFDVFDRMRRIELSAPNALSARELEVVRWTAQGKTSIEIGQILSLSDHTINAYMTNAIKKLDCVNRTQLVAKAIRLKLIN